jgi:hypothetical protein
MSADQISIGIGDKRDIQPWRSGVTYSSNEEVETGFALYIALVDHVSTVFATDLAAGKWIAVGGGGGGGGSVGTSNEFQITDNSGGFLASVVQQSGTHIIPTTTKVTDLGSATNRFNDLFIDSTLDYSANALVFKANNVTKVTFGDNGGTAINSLYNLFLNNSDIRFNSGGTTSVIKQDGGNNKLSLYNVDTKLRFRSDLAGEGKGIYIGAVGTILPFDNSNDSAIVIIDSTTQGFMQPSMTIAQRTAIASPLAGLQVHTEDGTDSIPYYNHSVDGWVPTGRYALNGAVINGGSAPTNSNMITSATTSGELTYAPFRWATGAGAYFMCTNTSGALSSAAIQLGAGSTLRWGTAWLTVANFSQEAQFSTGYIKGITGVNQLVLGGTTKASANAHVSFVNATGKIGVAVRDDGASFNNSVNIDASAIMDLTSTTRGFLPPRMTTVEMNTIATPATGLMIYDETTNQWMGYNGTSWVILG